MFINPLTVFYFLIISVVVLSLALFALIWLQIELMQKFSQLRKEKKEWLSSLDKKEMLVFEEAREKARQIVTNAQIAAARVEKDAKVKKSELEKLITSQNILVIEKISNDMKGILTAEINNFQHLLSQETINSERQARQKVEEVYQVMLSEVSRERAKRLKELEEEISEIIKALSYEVLGKSLSVDDQAGLILEALEKAKKEGMFKT